MSAPRTWIVAGTILIAACSSTPSASTADTARSEGEVTPTEAPTPGSGTFVEVELGEIAGRAMPIDGNRLYEGVANLTANPTITDGFTADGVLIWETPLGIESTGFDQANPFEIWAEGDAFFPLPIQPFEAEPTSERVPGTLAVSDGDIVVTLVEPTERYPHRALGDAVEAAAIAVTRIEDPVDPDQAVTRTEIVLDERDVVEGISAMLADLDGDGVSEIIVTVSNADGGARLVVYDQAGSFIAESAPIGTGNRWRHQIAVGPTGPNGETEIVVIRTPHIGGIVEWFRLEGDRLELVATFEPRNGGINTTSHVLGSTNLDLAAVFDADGDGELELVIPTQDRSSLAVVGRTSDGGELEQLVDVPGNVVTNLAVVARTDGTIAVAVGTDENQIATWASSP